MERPGLARLLLTAAIARAAAAATAGELFLESPMLITLAAPVHYGPRE